MSLSSPDALSEQRARVLQVVGRLGLVASIPIMGGLALYQALAGQPFVFMVVELVVTFASGLVLQRATPTWLTVPTAIFIVSFGLICVLAFNGFGPLLGVGMMLFAWLFATVFLTGRIVLPALVVVLLVLGMGGAARAGWTLAPWPTGDPSFIPREVLTTLVVAMGSAFLFQRIFDGLGAAVEREAAARAREAEANAAREASRAALEEARRLESIGRLAGGVAHDVNNALTVILGGMEALSHEGDVDRPQLLADMQGAAEGARATTRQLLSYARRDREPDAAPAALHITIPTLTRNLRRLLPEHVRVEVDAEPDLPPIGMSAGELEQALLNLALNARDAMPDGGTLSLGIAREGDLVRLEVRDEGSGMDADTRARVLEPFFTTKGASGTGLGLSMVHRSVERCGGTLRIDSAPGEGTRVCLTLPIAPESPETTHSSAATIEGARVLVLEDEVAVRRTLVRLLRRAGAEVTAVATVADAVAALADHAFDALLTDGILGDGDPLPAIACFLETGGRAVVIYSGHLEDSPVLARVTAGDHTFLRKPASGDELLGAIARELERP